MGSLLANVGIIFLAVYFYLRSKLGAPDQDNGTLAYLVKCILWEVLLGISLLSFSTVILGIRYDFRFLLFSFSAKYLDWKITSTSILLVAILRFFWGGADIAQTNLIISILMAVTLPMVVRFIRDRLNELTQLLILVTYSLLPTIVSTNYLIADKSLVLWICFILCTSTYAATFVIHYFIMDLYGLILSSSTDPLTGLKNVRTFNTDLMDVERQKKPTTLAVIDIDYFKDYNDCFGHDSGDMILKQMAAVFDEKAMPETAFYRIGGEEFAVIIDNPNPLAAEAFVHTLQETVAYTTFSLPNGDPISISISVGVAHSRIGETVKKTLKRADTALYQAKGDGRNQVVVSEPLL